MSDIATTLRDLRTKRGLTQEGLAVAAGVSRQTIAQIEGGRRSNSGTSTLIGLARALGVDLDALLSPPAKPKSKTKRRATA